MSDYQIDVKRFYLPILLEQICPKCGSVVTRDLSKNHYLSFPFLGDNEIYFYCYREDDNGNECETEFYAKYKLGFKLEEIKDENPNNNENS